MIDEATREVYSALIEKAADSGADAGENMLRKAALFGIFASDVCGRFVDR